MTRWQIVKVGYAVSLWISFSMLFLVQTMYGYGSRHEVRYSLYLLAVVTVLLLLSNRIFRSRGLGLPALILLSLALGFIPYEHGVPFLLNAAGSAVDGCRWFVCETTGIVRLAWSFLPATAYFLVLLPMGLLPKEENKKAEAGI